MKNIFLIILLLNTSLTLFAQTESITSNGKYVAAIIDKTEDRSDPVLVIQSTFDSWKREIPNGVKPEFT